MTIAYTVEDVILGEAGGRTKAERYADMLNIASVIANRAAAGRVHPQDVVAVPSQFNAYGKSLPAGVEKYRPTARAAWQRVQRTGPVHRGTYFATEAAKKNLPSGLTRIGAVEGGHVYFTDPQGRPFKTAVGLVRPVAPAAIAGLPSVAPVPTPRPARESATGPGLAALAPGYGRVNYTHEASRGPWQTGMQPEAVDSVRMLAASRPGGITINSAFRPPDINAAVGGARGSQHKTGNAFDVDLGGMSKAERAKFVETARMSGATRLGSYDKYPDMLHVDFAKGFGKNAGGVWAMHDRTAERLDNAPAWFHEGLRQVTVPTPTPAPRDVSRSLPPDRPMPATPPPTAPVAPEVPQAIPYAPEAAPPVPSNPVDRSIEQANAYNQFHGVPFEGGMHRAGLGFGPQPGIAPEAPVSLPPDRPMPAGPLAPEISRPARPVTPTVVRTPRVAPVRTAAPSRPVVPQAIRAPVPVRREPMDNRAAMAAAYAGSQGIGRGFVGTGVNAMQSVLSYTAPMGSIAQSRSNPAVSIQSLPGGFIAHTNSKYGWTEITDRDGGKYGISFGKVAVLSPDAKSWGWYTPQEAKELGAKGWTSVVSPGRGIQSNATGPSTGRSSSGGLGGFLSSLFGGLTTTAPSLSSMASPGPAGSTASTGGLGGFLSGLFGGPGPSAAPGVSGYGGMAPGMTGITSGAPGIGNQR